MYIAWDNHSAVEEIKKTNIHVIIDSEEIVLIPHCLPSGYQLLWTLRDTLLTPRSPIKRPRRKSALILSTSRVAMQCTSIYL